MPATAPKLIFFAGRINWRDCLPTRPEQQPPKGDGQVKTQPLRGIAVLPSAVCFVKQLARPSEIA